MSTSTTTALSSSSGQTPRPSASLVIVNERNEILLVHRNPQARHFGGVHVFPGGNFDKKQDASLAITAIRETFEESGLLLASSITGSEEEVPDHVLDEARRSIHEQNMLFETFLQDHKLKPDTSSLLPFTQWITPANVLRRFHTQFYVIFLKSTPSSGFTSGAKQERIPKPDGGQEVISARFLHPEKALEEFRNGNITFMPPQAYLLTTLSGLLQGRVNTPEQRTRVEELSAGMFGRMVINPRRLLKEDEEGRTILTYEGDETRGGSKGRLHRVLVKMGKTGITSEIKLQRNFDIFTEIEPQALATSSKL
ncbi:hypothetical protein BDZ94DRAFT_1151973 [Collybia nuda]|uniref:Nudix hydrolase domain-containing protein n=1 Tax=Collybia nuda TaxID=64659 RepID=A0A9P5YIF7_9AGAR|nr:hypothetical protein BDZ94DRAFT_1151973 [Collybia nuda]